MRNFHFDYHNYLELSEINTLAKNSPEAFVLHAEEEYSNRILKAVDIILERMETSRVVMLAGPSSSGKTTTAHRLTIELGKRGVRAATISMDDYFQTMDREDASIDYEAPERLDIELLRSHLEMLDAGAEIGIPHFDFKTGIQSLDTRTLNLGKGEVAIFEGIHALSDLFCSVGDPTGVYISARMRVTKENKLFMPPEWLRFTRRCVRDEIYRDATFQRTLDLWKNVRRGELRYILPTKENAHIQIDTTLSYEPCLFAPFAAQEMATLPEKEMRARELYGIAEALNAFHTISPNLIPADSLLREFIGPAK